MTPRIQVNMDEIPDFQMPDPGKHRAKLEECVNDVSQAGNDMLVWNWIVMGGDSDGLTIRSYTSLLPDALGGLKRHLAAFGFDGDVDVDTRKLHNRTAILIVVKSKYRDRNTGEEKEGVSVDNVLPDDKSPTDKPRTSKLQVDSGDEIPF